jgi:ABC-type molybdate transport system substrate-binding protein
VSRLSRLFLAFTLAVTISACTGGRPLFPGQQERTQMRVLFAGSLILPFDDLERAFEEQHPDVDVLMEGH